MISIGFQEETTSCRPPEWQIKSAFYIILTCCLITVSSLFMASHIAADINPVNSPEKSNATRLAMFLLDPDPGDEADNGLAGGAFDLLTVKLMHKPDIELVEREMIDKIMDEYALTLDQLVKPEKAIQLGKIAGADVTIVGKSVKNSKDRFLLVKVINNASGIIKDIAYFQLKDIFNSTMRSLVEFVWAASTSNITIDQKKFIAVGGFDDLSINDMQMDLGAEIRMFLEHKYSSEPGICVVTRSQMKPLLLELGLNEMGFTTAAKSLNSAQPAFTIMDGKYYVIRKARTIYVVNLRIEFLGKETTQLKVQGASWNEVLQNIGNRIDGLLKTVE